MQCHAAAAAPDGEKDPSSRSSCRGSPTLMHTTARLMTAGAGMPSRKESRCSAIADRTISGQRTAPRDNGMPHRRVRPPSAVRRRSRRRTQPAELFRAAEANMCVPPTTLNQSKVGQKVCRCRVAKYPSLFEWIPSNSKPIAQIVLRNAQLAFSG